MFNTGLGRVSVQSAAAANGCRVEAAAVSQGIDFRWLTSTLPSEQLVDGFSKHRERLRQACAHLQELNDPVYAGTWIPQPGRLLLSSRPSLRVTHLTTSIRTDHNWPLIR
jgi:hypothetical protein